MIKRPILKQWIAKTVYTFFACVLISCGPPSTTIIANPAGYDLKHPVTTKLPFVLNEISGLTYYSHDKSLFAIQDEEGYLYKIYTDRKDSMLRWKFAGHGDFEDLVLLDSTFYILRSDGDIFATTIKDSVTSTKYDFPDKGNEIESMYYDPALRQMILVCKSCQDDKRKKLSTYAFDPTTRQYVTDTMQFDTKEIARLEGEEKIKFKPSAAAINPLNGKIYLVSSVNKLLVIANRDGTIAEAYDLDPGLFKQPEGIAFAPDGTMYISNESADIGAATILTFPYHLNKK